METDRYKVAFSDIKLAKKLERDSPRWPALMRSFTNMELTQLEIVEQIAFGFPFTAWHNGNKDHEHFAAAQIIPVDMDTDDDDSSIDTLRTHPIVRSFSFLTYASPSHMVVGPRSRILFLLDKPITTVEGYKAAAATLYQFFPRCDTSVGEPSKFLYAMTSVDAPHWWNAKVLPVEQLRIWYEQWQRKLPKQQPVRHRNTVKMADYRNADLAVVADALTYIDPWSVDYNRWVGILAALKREFGDEAYSTAIGWAGGKPGEVEKKWERHLEEERSGPVMTVGSIFHIAKQNGWQRKKTGT